MSYKYSVVFVDPIPGLKQLPPAPNNQPYPQFQTTVDSQALQNWEQSEGQGEALKANQTLLNEYLTEAFPAWLQNYTNEGTDPNATPEQPPLGAMIQVYPDGVQWDLIQTGPPVCSVPPYTKIPPPQSSLNPNAPGGSSQMLNTLGGASPSTLFSNATPVNTVVTAPDGSVFVRIK
jgi:hypothetical protein